MIPIQNTIVSDDVAEVEFVCNLSKCKGACCVIGDLGAPLEEDELKIFEEIYPKVKPFLTGEGVMAIEEQGEYVLDEDGDYSTPLIPRTKACAYVIYEENGMTKCGIEKAYEKGIIDYQKPISCHLYPIRITKYEQFEAVNYDKWDICAPACQLGKELKVPVYQFLKKPLIRKYGEAWYQELEKAIADDKDKPNLFSKNL